MFGVILKLVTERPELLADHFLAYAALARTEIESARRRIVRRVIASAVALACGVAFLTLAGVAIMLATSLSEYSLWVLFGVPASMLLLSVLAAIAALSRDRSAERMTLVTQIHADLRELRRLCELRL